MKDFCVCILAYNEQKHIAETIESIAENCVNLNCDIKVYANGCTDDTVEIVLKLTQKIHNLYLRALSMASKPNAWNTAFCENDHPILIFSDGDVIPEGGAIEALWRLLSKEQSETVLAGCSFWPRERGLTLGQRFVGWMQIPLHQNFLSGQLYAIHRKKLEKEFIIRKITGIPLGIVAEDTFLEQILPPEKFTIIAHKVCYEPPSLADYCNFLARMRWQEEQLAFMYGDLLNGRRFLSQSNFARVMEKILSCHGINRLLLGATASGLRCVVKAIFKGKINQHYSAMGPVNKEGKNILSAASRSRSAK